MIIETQGLTKAYRTDVKETAAVDGVLMVTHSASSAAFTTRVVSALDGRIVSDKFQNEQ